MAKCHTAEFIDRHNVQAVRVSVDKRNDRDPGEKKYRMYFEQFGDNKAYVAGSSSESILTNCRVAMSG